MSRPISVRLSDVTKRHGETLSVDRLSLEIYQGEFFSILGPSGAGKTSTLRLLAGLDQPDHGEIIIQNQVMTHTPPNQRPVNMVFQQYALFPHLTVFDNVAFGLNMRRRSTPDINQQVREMLALVHLGQKHARLPSSLSGGEQQRVALARALINRPAVLLLDEPLGALDQQLRQDMQEELRQIQKQVGSTFVCVTHHQEEAMRLSDRLAIMQKGRILQVGTPQEIYEHPICTFVAQFMGESNHLMGRITDIQREQCRMEGSHFQNILAGCPPEVSIADNVTIIIRPERLHLSLQADQNGFDNCLPAMIQKATFNGKEMLYHLDLFHGIEWMARTPLGPGQPPILHSGQSVFVQWHASAGFLLTV